MTLNQLETLTEDEVSMALFIVNHVFPLESPKMELSPRHLTWFKHDALIKKLIAAFPRIKPEGHAIYVSLMAKLGVQGEVRYEQPPAPPAVQTTASVEQPVAPLTSSNPTTGSV